MCRIVVAQWSACRYCSMYDYFEIVFATCDCRQTSVVVSAASAVAHKVVAGLDRKILLCQVECTAQTHGFCI